MIQKWRVLPLKSYDAHMAMAIDEAISEAVASGNDPTIRFWTWNPSAVSIGYFQSLEDEVDIQKCNQKGVDFVRRRTGGGAVYHDSKGEITYSVIAKEELFPKDIIKSYHMICGWIIDGLKNLDLHTEFKPINDICLNGKKISGNAQTRRNRILLQHGTILHDLDVETMFSLLKVGIEKISDKVIQDVKQRVTCILDHKQISQEEVYRALLQGFTNGKEYYIGELTSEELQRAKELSEIKYSTKEWNFMR